MPIEYISQGYTFSLSYQELKQHHTRFSEMKDLEFLGNMPDVIHLACIICFLKEIPPYVCLTDKGIIHELVHLLSDNVTTTPLSEIRELFNTQLRLD